jgi:hypothetical protein
MSTGGSQFAIIPCNMWPLITLVIGVSLSGVMLPGPMFAVVLAKSYRSPWAGTLMSLGHAVVEVPIILLIYFGLARFFQNQIMQALLAILGGAMILWMGISMFHDRHESGQRRQRPALFRLCRRHRDERLEPFLFAVVGHCWQPAGAAIFRLWAAWSTDTRDGTLAMRPRLAFVCLAVHPPYPPFSGIAIPGMAFHCYRPFSSLFRFEIHCERHTNAVMIRIY